MLGARRQTVTVVAGELHSAGMIRFRRGVIVIRNRARLEESSCVLRRKPRLLSALCGTLAVDSGVEQRRSDKSVIYRNRPEQQDPID